MFLGPVAQGDTIHLKIKLSENSNCNSIRGSVDTPNSSGGWTGGGSGESFKVTYNSPDDKTGVHTGLIKGDFLGCGGSPDGDGSNNWTVTADVCVETTEQKDKGMFGIWVDQPNPGTRDAWAGNPLNPDSGHVYFSWIDCLGNSKTRGFYAEKTEGLTPSTPTAPSILKNDKGQPWDVKKTWEVSCCDIEKLKEKMQAFAKDPPQYNLHTRNCADVAIQAAETAGIHGIPDSSGDWIELPDKEGAGTNAGDLGEDLIQKYDDAERNNGG